MRAGTVRRRGGRAVLALLVGLLVGGWGGFGLTYLLKKSQFKDTTGVPDVALLEADELKLVPADAAGFVHVRAADLYRADALADLRKVVEKAGPDALKALDGFVPNPSTLDRVTLVFPKDPAPAAGKGPAAFPLVPGPLGLVGGGGPPVVVILAFAAPYDDKEFVKANLRDAGPKTVDRKEYWLDERSGVAAFFPSDRVVVVGPDAGMRAYLTGSPAADGPLAPALKLARAGGRHVVGGVNLTHGGMRDSLRGVLPPQAVPVLAADAMAVGMVLGSGARIDLRAAYKDAKAADAAEEAIRAAAADGRKALAELKAKTTASVQGKPGEKTPRPVEQMPEAVGGLFALGAANLADEWLAALPLQRDGTELSVAVTMPSLGAAYMTASAASLGMLLPAVQKVREAAARTSDQNNLKQIGIAFHNYHDSYGKMPSAVAGGPQADPKGRPLLSWRVAILPFVEHENLYRQFKLDEPWDSPHNKALIPMMPKVYASPTAPAEPGKTYYKVFVGPKAPFQADPRSTPRIPASFPDGTSNTILVAEGGDAVVWTKPDDFTFDPNGPLPDLSLPGRRVIQVVLVDGSVRTLNLDRTRPETIKLAIQPADGMVLPPDW